MNEDLAWPLYPTEWGCYPPPKDINGTLYRHNPHSHYALYRSKHGEWRESARVTNEMLNLNNEEG